MASWRDFSLEERDELLRRRDTGEDLDEIAAEVGMKSVTLRRNLQIWHNKRFGKARGEKDSEQVFEDSPDPNHTVFTSKSGRIRTVDQLLKACGVDLDEWAVERSQLNKWEGYRKSDKKNIVWEGGRIQEGFVDDDGSLVIEPLFQVKVWLVRKKPIAIEPVVRPVTITASPNLYENLIKERKSTKIALIIPDTHIGFSRDYRKNKLIPFHDRIALDIVSKLIALYDFDEIVMLGDMLDLPDWSDKFVRTPDYEQMTQPSIEETAWWMSVWRQLAGEAVKMHYIQGNHEKRQEDNLIKHLPQAYHLKGVNDKSVFSAWTIPNLLGLNDLNIEWSDAYPDGEVWLSDNFVAVHGDGLSAKKIIDTSSVNVMFGHVHRFEQSSRTVHKRGEPEVISAMCPGFLGKLDGAVPGRKNKQNWSQGLAIAYYTDEGDVTPIYVPIRSGKAIVEGMVIEGADQTDQIFEDLGERWMF